MVRKFVFDVLLTPMLTIDINDRYQRPLLERLESILLFLVVLYRSTLRGGGPTFSRHAIIRVYTS